MHLFFSLILVFGRFKINAGCLKRASLMVKTYCQSSKSQPFLLYLGKISLQNFGKDNLKYAGHSPEGSFISDVHKESKGRGIYKILTNFACSCGSFFVREGWGSSDPCECPHA